MLLLLFVCHLPCKAASFNCNGQISNIERAICGNKHLSLLDERLAIAFSLVRERFGGIAVNEQRRWLMERDLCKVDVSCLKREYEYRTELLNRPGYKPAPRPGTGLDQLPPPTISNLDSRHNIDAILQECFSDSACRQYLMLIVPKYSERSLMPEAAVFRQLQLCSEDPYSLSAVCWSFIATFLENEMADRIKFALQGVERICELRVDRKQFLWETAINSECDREAKVDLDTSQYGQAYSYCRGNRIRDQIAVLKSVGNCLPCSKCLAAW
jgi:hypothetical protein